MYTKTVQMQYKIFLFVTVFLMISFINIDSNAAESNKKAIGDTFERDYVLYKVIQEGSDLDLGKVQVIGMTKPLTIVNIYEVVSDPYNYEEFEVTSIASGAFKNRKSIRQFLIDDDCEISEIPSDCLMGCSKLTNVFLFNKSLKRIGKNAFRGCKKLKFFRIDTKTIKQKSIGKNAFKGVKNGMIVITPSTTTRKYVEYFKNRGAHHLVYALGYNGYYIIKR